MPLLLHSSLSTIDVLLCSYSILLLKKQKSQKIAATLGKFARESAADLLTVQLKRLPIAVSNKRAVFLISLPGNAAAANWRSRHTAREVQAAQRVCHGKKLHKVRPLLAPTRP